MKILVLGSKEYPIGTNKGDDPHPSGGIEVYVNELIPRLADAGKLEFSVLTRRFKGTSPHEKEGGVEVHRVRWIKGFYFRNLSFNFFSFIKALRLDFDLIFSQDLFATFFAIFLSKIKRRKVVAVVHGTASAQPQYNWLIRRLLRRLEFFTFKRADQIVSLTDQPKKDLEKHAKFDDWNVIPFGIDRPTLKDFEPSRVREELGIKPDVTIIAFVGRLLKVKGVHHLLEALGRIKDENCILLIIGSGPDESSLKKMAAEQGLTDRVIFLGFRWDVRRLLEAADIYVLPSLSEGLSISLLEAKAAGCACIVTDIGLPVEGGKTALVVKPGNPHDLSTALLKLLADKELRIRLGERARADAIENYNWAGITSQYKELFKELAKRPKYILKQKY